MRRTTPTIPFTNLTSSRDSHEAYLREYAEVCALYQEGGEKPIDFLKAHLGEQDYCDRGEFRYWVWERLAPDLLGDTVGYRVSGSNSKGVVFEVVEGSSLFQAQQAWNHFRESLGFPRNIPYLTVFEERVRLYVDSVAGESALLSGVENLVVLDDGNPEGGVFVNVSYLIRESRVVDPEVVRDRVKFYLESRMHTWSKYGGRSYKIEFEGADFEGTYRALVAFYFPALSLKNSTFMALAHRVWEANGGESSWGISQDYKDAVICISPRNGHLQVERRSNKNPTTMAPFIDGVGGAIGVPFRHHGEHIYITKHLMKIAENT